MPLITILIIIRDVVKWKTPEFEDDDFDIDQGTETELAAVVERYVSNGMQYANHNIQMISSYASVVLYTIRFVRKYEYDKYFEKSNCGSLAGFFL